jgi:hypothetical protein
MSFTLAMQSESSMPIWLASARKKSRAENAVKGLEFILALVEASA